MSKRKRNREDREVERKVLRERDIGSGEESK